MKHDKGIRSIMHDQPIFVEASLNAVLISACIQRR